MFDNWDMDCLALSYSDAIFEDFSLLRFSIRPVLLF